MDVRHLRIFIAVAEEGTTTAAAQRLFISQPTVSQAISEMERHYQVKLFERQNRKLQLNATGEIFLTQARFIMAQFAQLNRQMMAVRQSDTLRIGMSIGMDFLLPRCSEVFYHDNPGRQLSVSINNSQAIAELLANAEIDLAILAISACDESCATTLLWEDEWVFLTSENHPLQNQEKVAFTDLQAYPILLREKGCSSRVCFDDLCQYFDCTITPLWQSVSSMAIIEAVSKGQGIALVPFTAARGSLKAGVVSELVVDGVCAQRQVVLAMRTGHRLRAQERSFMDICVRISQDLRHEEYFSTGTTKLSASTPVTATKDCRF